MKQYFFYTLFMSLVFMACQKPDPILPNTDNTIGSVWVNIPGYNSIDYKATFNASGDSAFIEIPYYFPLDSNSEVNLKQLMVRMNVPLDAKINPGLNNQMDLSNPQRITVTSGNGQVRSFVLSVKKIGDYGIRKIRIAYGTKDTVDGIQNGTDVLFFVLPGTDVSNATLLYQLNPHSTGSIANNSKVNLMQPLPFGVTGADGATKMYTLKAQAPNKLPYGIGIYRKLWYMPISQIPQAGAGTGSNETSIAVSGDYLLLLNNAAIPTGKIRVYNRMNMAYVRDLVMPPLTGSRIFGMAADSLGNFLVSTFTTSGNYFVYKYTSAFDDNPVKLFQYAYTPTGSSSIGRTIRLYGDLSKDAIIFTHESATTKLFKWTIKSGALVSTTPEILTYTSLSMPTGATNWGNYAEAIASSTNAGTNYFLNYPGELVYVNGATNAKISGYPKASDVSYQYPITFFNFNNARYLVAEYFKGATNNSSYFSVFDVTDPSKFGTPAAKVLDSDLSDLGASNGNGTGDICAIVSTDKTKVHVYMLLTNGGIMCYELTLYQ